MKKRLNHSTRSPPWHHCNSSPPPSGISLVQCSVVYGSSYTEQCLHKAEECNQSTVFTFYSQLYTLFKLTVSVHQGDTLCSPWAFACYPFLFIATLLSYIEINSIIYTEPFNTCVRKFTDLPMPAKPAAVLKKKFPNREKTFSTKLICRCLRYDWYKLQKPLGNRH